MQKAKTYRPLNHQNQGKSPQICGINLVSMGYAANLLYKLPVWDIRLHDAV